eukprot:1923459-Rhodomonas_salina.1
MGARRLPAEPLGRPLIPSRSSILTTAPSNSSAANWSAATSDHVEIAAIRSSEPTTSTAAPTPLAGQGRTSEHTTSAPGASTTTSEQTTISTTT